MKSRGLFLLLAVLCASLTLEIYSAKHPAVLSAAAPVFPYAAPLSGVDANRYLADQPATVTEYNQCLSTVQNRHRSWTLVWGPCENTEAFLKQFAHQPVVGVVIAQPTRHRH